MLNNGHRIHSFVGALAGHEFPPESTLTALVSLTYMLPLFAPHLEDRLKFPGGRRSVWVSTEHVCTFRCIDLYRANHKFLIVANKTARQRRRGRYYLLTNPGARLVLLVYQSPGPVKSALDVRWQDWCWAGPHRFASWAVGVRSPFWRQYLRWQFDVSNDTLVRSQRACGANSVWGPNRLTRQEPVGWLGDNHWEATLSLAVPLSYLSRHPFLVDQTKSL